MANLVDPPIAPPTGDEDPIYRSLVREWRTGLVGYLRDVLLNGSQIRVEAYRSSDQSISATTRTKVVWNAESYDLGEDMSGADFTAPLDGYYNVSAAVLVASNVSGDLVSFELDVDSSVKALHQYQAPNGAWTTSNIAKTVWADKGDVINVYITNDTTACTVKASVSRSYFQITRVGGNS